MNKEEYEIMKTIVEDGMINITKDDIVHMSRETFNKFRSYKNILDRAINYLKKEMSYYERTYRDVSYFVVEELLDILEGKEKEEEENE